MKGVQVGRVRDVRLRYIPENATLQTPVTIEIDPRQLQLDLGGLSSRADLRARLNDALSKLVAKGMRAKLSTSLLLPGAAGVSLENAAGTGTGRLVVENDPPIIPAAGPSGGIEGALGALNNVAARIEGLPIEEIAENLRSTSARINTLVQDRNIDQSLQRLNRSLANVEKVTATASENVGPIVESLRNAASAAETAAGQVQGLIGTAAARQNYDLGEMVKELTRAAEAVRALAAYLEENPDALLKGRGKAK